MFSLPRKTSLRFFCQSGNLSIPHFSTDFPHLSIRFCGCVSSRRKKLCQSFSAASKISWPTTASDREIRLGKSLSGTSRKNFENHGIPLKSKNLALENCFFPKTCFSDKKHQKVSLACTCQRTIFCPIGLQTRTRCRYMQPFFFSPVSARGPPGLQFYQRKKKSWM